MAVFLKPLTMLAVNEEATPGTCSFSGLTWIAAQNIVFSPEFETFARNLQMGILGIPNEYLGARLPILTFTTEIRGAGTTSTNDPPAEAPLYKAAGLAETVGASTVTYAVSSDKSEWAWLSVELWIQDSGNDYWFRFCGCQADASFHFANGAPGTVDWTLTGIFREVSTEKDFYGDAAAPSISRSAIVDPLPPQALCSDFHIGSYTSPVSMRWDIDLNNNVNRRPSLGNNCHGYNIPYISARNPGGSMHLEWPRVSEYDYMGTIIDNTIETVFINVGDTPGNQYTFSVESQFIGWSEENNDQIVGVNAPFVCRDEDDGELSIIFT